MKSLQQHSAALPAQLQGPARKAKAYASENLRKNTKRTYRAGWGVFIAWCKDKGVESLPCTIDTVALFVSDMAESRKYNTLVAYMSAISVAHKTAGHDTPVRLRDEPLRSVWGGIRNTHGSSSKKVAPVMAGDLVKIGQYIDGALVNATAKDRLTLLRDKAILLIGFTGVMRRSEIAAIEIDKIRFTDEGIVITLFKTKGDKNNAGVEIPVYKQERFCPVDAIKAWIKAAGIRSGFVFQRVDRHGNVGDGTKAMSGQSIATIVKNYASIAGLNASAVSGHSLRRGCATQMARNGEPDRIVMRHGRWKTQRIVDEYVEAGTQFSEDNPTKRLGL